MPAKPTSPTQTDASPKPPVKEGRGERVYSLLITRLLPLISARQAAFGRTKTDDNLGPASHAWRERLQSFQSKTASLSYAERPPVKSPGATSAAKPLIAKRPLRKALPALKSALSSFTSHTHKAAASYRALAQKELIALRQEWDESWPKRAPAAKRAATPSATTQAPATILARTAVLATKGPLLKLPALSLPRIQLPIRRPRANPVSHARKNFGGKLLPLGLDIGTTAIKWAQLAHDNGKSRIVRLGVEPLTAAPSASSEARLTELRDQLKRIAANHGLSGPVAISLAVDDTRFRLTKLPVLPPEEMQQALRWQVEQNLPAQTTYQDMVVDYTALPMAAGLTESRIMLVTVPRQRVTAALESLRCTGFTPVAVEVDPSSIQAGLAWLGKTSPNETALLLHFGASSASFSILVGGQLAFSRAILATGNSLTQIVSEQLRVSPVEAENLKRAHGLLKAPGLVQPAQGAADADGKAGAVSQSLSSSMENLMVDLLHAFKGFSHQMTQSQIQRFDRVYIDGGGAQMPGLIPWLQLRMGAPVEMLNPLAGAVLDTALSAQAWEPSAPQLSIAVGLAAREIVESRS